MNNTKETYRRTHRAQQIVKFSVTHPKRHIVHLIEKCIDAIKWKKRFFQKSVDQNKAHNVENRPDKINFFPGKLPVGSLKNSPGPNIF